MTPDYGLPWFNNAVAAGPRFGIATMGFRMRTTCRRTDDILTLG